MTTWRTVDTRLVACDIAERLGVWSPNGRRMVKKAVDRHGADLVWQLVDDACLLERVSVDAPRRRIFFDLLKRREERRG